jgi:hypothetical protein
MGEDDQTEEAPEAPAPATRPARPRWMLPAIVLFVVGLGLGLVGGVVLFDDSSSDDGGGPVAPEVDCEEAQAVVDQAVASIDEINQSETQDVSFFAAILVEQRTITFAMDAAPSCFSLEERAGAVGLLDGIQALLDASATAAPSMPASEGPVVLEPTDSVPRDPATTEAP